jgi:hypothetical protein
MSPMVNGGPCCVASGFAESDKNRFVAKYPVSECRRRADSDEFVRSELLYPEMPGHMPWDFP